MMKQICLFIAAFVLIGIFTHSAHAIADIQRDKTNAYLLSNKGELFFPQGANVGYLLQENVSELQLDATFAMLADSGVNTVRVNLEDAVTGDAKYNDLFIRTGEFNEAILGRFDKLLTAAKKHNLQVMPILFDLQAMKENWDASPQNQANGGSCKTIHDFFLKSNMRQQAMNRMLKFTKRFEGRNIFALEIARGANVWGGSISPDKELQGEGLLWLNLLLDQLHRSNTQRHLTAISFMPNTLPYDLMENVDILLINFRSRAINLAANSIKGFLSECRKYNRPVFICEAEWSAKPARRDQFIHTLFWSSLALNSNLFLSPVDVAGRPEFSRFDLQQTNARETFMPLLDFTGPARPPSRAPVKVDPKDQYLLIDNIVGNDRFFWLFTKEPGESKANLELLTIEGVYELQWFDIENLQPLQRKQFNQWRKQLNIVTPSFEQSIFGVLHLVTKASPKDKNGTPSSDPSDENAPSLGNDDSN